MTRMGSERKGAGKATHYICLHILSLSFYHSSGSMTFGAHSHLSRVKSLSKKLSSGVGKPAICNNVMTKQAMT